MLSNSLRLQSIVLAGLAFSAGAGWAFEEKPFDTTAFEAAQSSGKPLLIDVFAPWCPVCKAQQAVLGGLKQDAKYDDLTVLKVDFDNQPDVSEELQRAQAEHADRLQRQDRNRPLHRRYQQGVDRSADQHGDAVGRSRIRHASRQRAIRSSRRHSLDALAVRAAAAADHSRHRGERASARAPGARRAASHCRSSSSACSSPPLATASVWMPASSASFAALLLIGIGVILWCRSCRRRLPPPRRRSAAGPRTTSAASRPAALYGQFALGLLLGAVWSPCVGPTLGAASVLASQGEDLGQVALVMLAFGLGAALPLLLLGLLSRDTLMRWRGRLMEAGKGGKLVSAGCSSSSDC